MEMKALRDNETWNYFCQIYLEDLSSYASQYFYLVHFRYNFGKVESS